MAEKQTHTNVLPETKRKLEILRGVRGLYGYELIEGWTNEAWEKAKKEGLVTDAMISPIKNKKNATGETIAV